MNLKYLKTFLYSVFLLIGFRIRVDCQIHSGFVFKNQMKYRQTIPGITLFNIKTIFLFRKLISGNEKVMEILQNNFLSDTFIVNFRLFDTQRLFSISTQLVPSAIKSYDQV